MTARDPLAMIGPYTTVWRERTAFFDAAIVDTPALGRALFLDGVLQSAAVDEAHYHRALIEPALALLQPGGPQEVLVLGAGECATIREVLAAPDVHHVLAVDVDAILMAAVRRYMPQWHAGVLDDARVSLRIEDARRSVAASASDAFDLVVVDLTDAPDEAPERAAATTLTAPLVDLEFAHALRRVLRRDGVLAMQAGEAAPPEAARVHSPVEPLRQVFARVNVSTCFIASFDLDWRFIHASG